jgi:hypothetical protein
MSRRKKNRANRKDAPTAPPFVDFRFGRGTGHETQPYENTTYRPPDPECVHTTVNGRGVVARIKK